MTHPNKFKAATAIRTLYDGVEYRSRAEGKTAAFLDGMGLEFHYENAGFETSEGRYLPDFWIPELSLWLEVKGTAPSEKELRKAAALADMTYRGVLPDMAVTTGPPTASGGLAVLLRNERRSATGKTAPARWGRVKSGHGKCSGSVVIVSESARDVSERAWLPSKADKLTNTEKGFYNNARFEFGEDGKSGAGVTYSLVGALIYALDSDKMNLMDSIDRVDLDAPGRLEVIKVCDRLDNASRVIEDDPGVLADAAAVGGGRPIPSRLGRAVAIVSAILGDTEVPKVPGARRCDTSGSRQACKLLSEQIDRLRRWDECRPGENPGLWSRGQKGGEWFGDGWRPGMIGSYAWEPKR